MLKFKITVQGVTKLLEDSNGGKVFKKGDRHSLANYKPIFLTFVYAKLLEHIICKQIMFNFSKN